MNLALSQLGFTVLAKSSGRDRLATDNKRSWRWRIFGHYLETTNVSTCCLRDFANDDVKSNIDVDNSSNNHSPFYYGSVANKLINCGQ